MGMFKTNTVKVDIGSYIHYWRGIKKVGKTTLFYNLVQEQYGDLNNGLLISIGDEIGYNALDGLVYAEAGTWRDLLEIVDELEENKEENTFKIIGLDTADEMIKLAKEEVKRLHKKAKGSAVEFNACFGGYGAPRDMVAELIDDVIARIRKSGYGIVIIGHTKIRDIKEKNGDEYQQLTSNLNADYDGIFSNKADIVMTIAIENDINKNKKIENTTRYMWFRSDGFVDAGGRFPDIPEKIEYGAKNYIDVFEEGVKKSIRGKITEKQIAETKKKEVEERESSAKEYRKNKIDKKENEELIAVIKNAFPNLNDKEKRRLKDIMAEYDYSSFLDDDIPTESLKKIIKELKIKDD